jgi:hypothetical protein
MDLTSGDGVAGNRTLVAATTWNSISVGGFYAPSTKAQATTAPTKRMPMKEIPLLVSHGCWSRKNS